MLELQQKIEMQFQKSFSLIFNRQYAVTPPAQNSSIHSMFALQGSGFTPVVAQACHLNKTPIQFKFSHCKHLLKRQAWKIYKQMQQNHTNLILE